ATRGFCAGDDESEYFITQECNSNLCSDNQNVRGVSSKPQACVLDGSIPNAQTGTDGYKVYQPGDKVKFNLGDRTKAIRCFAGTWYDQWPVVAEKSDVEITAGDSKLVDFSIINPTQRQQTFEASIESGMVTEFQSNQRDTITVTVDAQGSETVSVSTTGRQSGNDGKVTVEAVSRFSDLEGSDSTSVDVVDPSAAASAGGPDDPNEVPGITFVQVLAAAATAAGYLLFT
ncbi:MAG: hypothetical protein ABEJ03_05060, partial [Candidatus Nanohaloarchaea archaeon]